MIYIIVLNWNGAEDTINCIDSLLKLNCSICQYKIIICDNSSSDNSVSKIMNYLNKLNNKNILFDCESVVDRLDSLNHDIYFIKNNVNNGYAAGNNLGVKLALKDTNCEYVWILNNDTEVMPNSLDELYSKVKSSNYGICGSKLVYFDQPSIMQGVGGIYNSYLGITSHVLEGRSIDTQIDEQFYESKIDYIIGASIFIDRKLIDDIGLMAEDYFLYFEELDYAIRAKEKKYKLGIASNSVVYHKEGASTSKSKVADYYAIRNKFIINKRYFSFLERCVIRVIIIPILFNRLKRREFKKFINAIYAFFNIKKYNC